MAKKTKTEPRISGIQKCPTGINGFDQITRGGLPRGRASLIYGPPGAGKTIFALEFLVKGVRQFSEPGLLVTFQERAEDIAADMRFFGWDLSALIADGKLDIDHVLLEPGPLLPAEDANLDGLMVRMQDAIEKTGARRLVLDGVDYLLAGLSSADWVRYELGRLLGWLRDREITVLVTAEMSDTGTTQYQVEPYLVDCVIRLDSLIDKDVSTRRLRVTKYRGSAHSADEFPFLIGGSGIEVLPVTSVGLDYEALEDKISSGIPGIDEMLEGGGFFRGSSVLISGNAGTGKSSFAASFAMKACRSRKRCLYIAFEESAAQIVRNMNSIGLDLKSQLKRGRLKIYSARPNQSNIEGHLAAIQNLVDDFGPEAVIIDPINSFLHITAPHQARTFFMRLVDFFKARQITSICTHLSHSAGGFDRTEVGISSLMDTWIDLKNITSHGEQNRILTLIKSRGMNHSNQMREYLITHRGIQLVDIFLGPEGILTGSARSAQEAANQAEALILNRRIEDHSREVKQKRELLETQIAYLRAQFEVEKEALERSVAEETGRNLERTLQQRRLEKERKTVRSPRGGGKGGGDADK